MALGQRGRSLERRGLGSGDTGNGVTVPPIADELMWRGTRPQHLGRDQELANGRGVGLFPR